MIVQRSHSEEVAALTETLVGCKPAHKVDVAPEWALSPYGFLKRPSPTAIGALIEDAVRQWLDAEPRRNTNHDLVLGELEVELKAATRQPSGIYQFNQIRPLQTYDGVLFLAISPHDLRGWYADKGKAVAAGSHQHCGEDLTLMLSFYPANPPAGFNPPNGSLADLRALLPRPTQRGLFSRGDHL